MTTHTERGSAPEGNAHRARAQAAQAAFREDTERTESAQRERESKGAAHEQLISRNVTGGTEAGSARHPGFMRFSRGCGQFAGAVRSNSFVFNQFVRG